MHKYKMLIMLVVGFASSVLFANDKVLRSEKRGVMVSKTFKIVAKDCIDNLKYKGSIANCQFEADPSDDYIFPENFQLGAKWTSLSTEVGNLEFRLLLHLNGYAMDFESLNYRDLTKQFIESYIQKAVNKLSAEDRTIEYFEEDAE